MSVLTDLKNRRVIDIFFLVCDSLKELPDVLYNAWPLSIFHTCIIHLIRYTFPLTSRQRFLRYQRDIKPIYTAPNAQRLSAALHEL